MSNLIVLRSEQAAYTVQAGHKTIATALDSTHLAVTAGYTYQVSLSYKAACALLAHNGADYSYASGEVKASLRFLASNGSTIVSTVPLVTLTTPSEITGTDITAEALSSFQTSVIAPGTAAYAEVHLEVNTTIYTTIGGTNFPNLATSGVYIDLSGAFDAISVLESASAVLSRKLYFGPDLTYEGGPLVVDELGAVSDTPPAGKQLIYVLSDGKWYTKNSAGVQTQIGAGAGSGDDTLMWMGF
jgi:hypothetical protein